MASDYKKILELSNKNNMGLSNTIKRDYGIPLDYSSVQESYEAALEYAKTNTLAYIGQPIAVNDVLYIVTTEAEGYLKQVGIKLVGDENSVIIDEDGRVSIYGFDAAPDITLPRKTSTGALEWVTLASILPKDNNTKTVVKAVDDSDITVSQGYDEATDTYTYTLDVEFPAIPAYSITKEAGEGKTTYKLTKDGVAIGEAVDVPDAYDDTSITTRMRGAEEDIDNHENRLKSIEVFFEDAARDEGAGENLKNALDTLVEIQTYINTDGEKAVKLTEDVQKNTADIAALNSTTKAISDTITEHVNTAARTYAKQTSLDEVKNTADAAAVKTEVDEALKDKVDTSTFNTYKNEVSNQLSNITGGAAESVANLKTQLAEHESKNNEKFGELDSKDESQDTLIAGNTAAINTINTTISNITNEETGILATAAGLVGELKDGAIKENADNISAISQQIEQINGNIDTLDTALKTVTGSETEEGSIKNVLAKVTEVSKKLGGEFSETDTVASRIDAAQKAIDDLTSENTSERLADIETFFAGSDYDGVSGGSADSLDTLADIQAVIGRPKISDEQGVVQQEATGLHKDIDDIKTKEIGDQINTVLSDLKTETSGDGSIVRDVTQTNGKITVTKGNLTSEDIPPVPASKVHLETAGEGDATTLDTKLANIENDIADLQALHSVELMTCGTADPDGSVTSKFYFKYSE